MIQKKMKSACRSVNTESRLHFLHSHGYTVFHAGYCVRILLVIFTVTCIVNDISSPSAQDLLPFSKSASEMNETDSQAKRYDEFRTFHFRNIHPLAKEAKRKGLSVSQDEFDAQKSALIQMYNDTAISDQIVKSEVLARKYAQTILNIQPDATEKENAYKQILAQFSGEEPPSEQTIVSLIESRAIGNSPVIKNELVRIAECNEQRRVDYENEHPEEMWNVEDLQIKSNDDFCLARHPDSSTCQLSVRRFNALVQYQPFPRMVPLDSARQQAIRNILSDQYVIDQARKSGYDRSDAAAGEIAGRLEWEVHDALFKNLGTPVTDDGMLHIMYDQYFDVLFRSRKIVHCSLIGSSDSLYIDSLTSLFTLKTASLPEKENSPVRDTSWIASLPWSHSSTVAESPQFEPFLDSLCRGDITKPICTPYGYFLVRLDSISVQHEIPFEDATEKCVLLATKQKWRNLDSALSADAFAVYSTADSYKLKDTLSLSFFLSPGAPPDSNSVKRKKNTKSVDELQKVAAEKGIRVSSSELPFEILDALQRQYTRSDKKKRFFGPIVSSYGVCYCKVLGVKPAKGAIPYRQVRNKIIDSLIIAAVSLKDLAVFEKPDSVLKEVTLARVYAPTFIEDDGSGNIELTGGADSETREARFAAIEEWVDKMNIRIP